MLPTVADAVNRLSTLRSIAALTMPGSIETAACNTAGVSRDPGCASAWGPAVAVTTIKEGSVMARQNPSKKPLGPHFDAEGHEGNLVKRSVVVDGARCARGRRDDWLHTIDFRSRRKEVETDTT